MDIEYLIIGVSKDSKEDFLELYRRMRVPVYAAALATVKDKALAREIAVEVFRRIKTHSHTFDTELNGEYWILDMVRQLSLNTLQEPALRNSRDESGVADNASVLVLKTLSQLKNERGFILTLQSVSTLSGKDIATLSGFYHSSAARESRRGLLELRASYPKISKKQLKQSLKEDFTNACPDYLEYIQLDRMTKVSYVSHEAMFLEDAEMTFHGETESENIQARANQQKMKSRRRLKIIVAVILCVILLASGIAIIYNLVQDAAFPDEPERVQTNASMEMVEVNGVLYYRDATTGIFAYDSTASSPTAQLIYKHPVRDMIAVENGLCFRNYKDGKIYYIDYIGQNLRLITDMSGTSLAYGPDGFLYYNASSGIYKISLTQENAQPEAVYTEEIETAPTRYHMNFTNDGTLIFSAGADSGIYRLEENSLFGLYMDEAYYFQIQGNVLFFDAIGLRDVRYLYGLDLTKNAQQGTSVIPEIRLYSAAYYVVGNRIFYEGYGDGDSEVNGLYCLNMEDGSRTLIEKMQDNQLHITDIYVSESKLYCYYSDGKTDGSSTLIARPLDDLDKTETIF